MTSAPSSSPAKSSASAAAGSLRDVVAAPTSICTIDGQAGKLIYRGYLIEDLAAHSTFEETVWLLWHGELPSKSELDQFKTRLARGRAVPQVSYEHLRLVPPGAHPLAVLRTAVSQLSDTDPQVEDMTPAAIWAKAERLQGQVATLVCARGRMRDGNEPVAPREDLSLAANFLYMLFGKEPDEREAHALDVSLILHAEHEFNASTFTIRVAAGTYVDLHSALTAALASLKGPRHGGANEDVIDMIEEIGDPSRAEGWARDRLARYRSASREQRADPSLRFPGFGHAVYRVLDPRARVLKTLAAEIAERKGVHGIAEIQESVANVVTSELGIYPNVDYYSAGLYHALGVPKDMFTSIFATSRTSGWIAHYEEQLREGRLIRPRGEYHGPAERPLKR